MITSSMRAIIKSALVYSRQSGVKTFLRVVHSVAVVIPRHANECDLSLLDVVLSCSKMAPHIYDIVDESRWAHFPAPGGHGMRL